VVVKPLSEEEMTSRTPSGIIIPDTAKKESKEGTVVAVGPGRFEEGMRTPLSVKVGDRVLYREGYDNDVELDGEKYFILPEESILAILK
jgi:chaperonin GroES